MVNFLEKVYDVLDIISDLPPILKWATTFTLIFVFTFLLYLLLASPLILFGMSFKYLIGGAIGCGIGTAFVNATAFTLFTP
jgi:hypothetical protein